MKKNIVLIILFLSGLKVSSQHIIDTIEYYFPPISREIVIDDTMYYSGKLISNDLIENLLCDISNYCLYKDNGAKVVYKSLFSIPVNENYIGLLFSTFEYPYYSKIWLYIYRTSTYEITSKMLVGAVDPNEECLINSKISQNLNIELSKLFNMSLIEAPISNDKEIVRVLYVKKTYSIQNNGRFYKTSDEELKSYKARMIYDEKNDKFSYDILEEE